MEATLNTEIQATIPKVVWEYLDLKPGARFRFYFLPDGAVVVLPGIATAKLKGTVPILAPPVSIEQMGSGN